MGGRDPAKGFLSSPENSVLLLVGAIPILPLPFLPLLSPPLFGHRIEMQKKDSQKESPFLAEKSLITG